MGNQKTRNQNAHFANYDTIYNPHFKYEGIENYGSTYQCSDEKHSVGYGVFNTLLKRRENVPKIDSRTKNQDGLCQYGKVYDSDFNPMLQSAFKKPKVRVIFMPSNVVAGFQNLIKQGTAIPCSPFINSGVPQIWPQMNSNCCSMPLQMPSIPAQVPYSTPSPPPMVQPIIQQPSIVGGPISSYISVPPSSLPYMPHMFPAVPQQVSYPYPYPYPYQGSAVQPQQLIHYQNAPHYGGFSQGMQQFGGLSNYGGFSNIGGNIMEGFNSISQPGLAAYAGYGQVPYNGYGQVHYGGYSHIPYGGYLQMPYNNNNNNQMFVNSFNQLPYGVHSQNPNVAYNYVHQSPSGVFYPGMAPCTQMPLNQYYQPGFYGSSPIQAPVIPTYPQQQSFNSIPQPLYNPCPIPNMNIIGNLPQFNGFGNPCVLPSTIGQITPYSGTPGRVTIVCCAIPHY